MPQPDFTKVLISLRILSLLLTHGLVLFLLLSKSNVRVFSLVAKTNLRNKNFKNHVAFPFQTPK